MGKFDGILLCTDLDDTLLTSDKRISEENKKAIEYFMKEGGLFTFATGRVPLGAKLILDQLAPAEPNAPLLCYNGAGIYDTKSQKLLWSVYLDKAVCELCRYVDTGFPSAGIEVCSDERVYFSKSNRLTAEHQKLENFPDNFVPYDEVTEGIKKIIFMVETEEMEAFRRFIADSPYAKLYNFVQSSPWYYEVLPLGADKGTGLMKLAQILRISPEKTVAMGDNENDISLVTKAGVGVAVANASKEVQDAADYITVDNNSNAVAVVIYSLNNGNVTFGNV